jgi:small-conductance mechanosensitive channel
MRSSVRAFLVSTCVLLAAPPVAVARAQGTAIPANAPASTAIPAHAPVSSAIPAPALAVAPAASAAPAQAPAPSPAVAPAGASSPEPAAASGALAGGAFRPTPLVYFNRTILVMRATVGGFVPAERADLARQRIDTLVRRDGPGLVAVQPGPIGLVVSIDGALAFTVAAADAEVPEGEPVDAAAARAAAALRQAIAESREGHDLRALTIALVLAGAATLVYGGLLWIIARLSRVAAVRLLRAAGEHADQLMLGNVHLFDREHMRHLLRRTILALFWLLALVLSYGWLSYVLELFPYTRPWGERLTGFLVDALGGILGGIAQGVPQLAIAALILLIARFVSGLVQRFFRSVEVGRLRLGWLDQQTVRPTRKIAVFFIWMLAGVMAYPYLPGADTDAFKGLSVLVGLMVSIGGASVVGQALSGLIVMYTHTFRPGDYVRVGEHQGTVMEIGVYQTRIRTGLGEELMLPSSTVLGAVTRNYSRPHEGEGFILDAQVTIGYDAPWRQVEAMLVEAARRTPEALAEPAPRVFETALSDFYVEYRLVAQSKADTPTARAQARARLYRAILDVFNEHGVQIMSPHYQVDPHLSKVVPKDRWYEAPARPDTG